MRWGGCEVVTLVVCLSELVTVGLLVFSHGFLLTRQVIVTNSTCPDVKKAITDQQEGVSLNTNNTNGNLGIDDIGCVLPPTFNRTVILLIDALRFDFAAYQPDLKDEDALPYQNKMPVFADLLHSHPQQSYLVPFLADAPTTTMQRLKGLTTGSLPTFIDASHNFASEEITEDNIIDQLIKGGKQITILGDDTWGGLFPGRFHRSHLFPSFDVMDLDTVDRGVESHLDEELAKGDWDVLLAHFLGVDHCGHRYGPTHTQMTRKLTEMNDIIKSVAETITKDTLLVVIGDHGMTQTGDHGGDSDLEVTTTLFLYSPALSVPQRAPQSVPQHVAQVDLVPSLALALGVPIPYSNLGQVMDEMLVTAGMSKDEADTKYTHALSINIKQVQRYLTAYRDLGNTYPEDLWQRLKTLNQSMTDGKHLLSLRELRKIYSEYLTLARVMCQEIWAKFNVAEILSGLVLMLSALVLLSIFTICDFSVLTKIFPVTKRVLLLTLLVNCMFLISLLFSSYLSLHLVGYVAGVIVMVWVIFHKKAYATAKIKLNHLDFISVSLCLILLFGSFSNSYVVVENYVVSFLLLLIVTVQALTLIVKQQQSKASMGSGGKNSKLPLNIGSLVCIVALVVVMVCVRCGAWFWRCREEQYWCSPSLIHIPLTGLPKEAHNVRYATSLLSLVLLIWLPRRWLLTCGNLNGTRFGVLMTRYVPVVCGLLVAAYWALQAITTVHHQLSVKEQVIPPQLVFQAALFFSLGLFTLPLLIYEVKQSTTSTAHMPPSSSNPAVLIPQLYRRLKEKYDEQHGRQAPNIPIVYGLATSVSAPLVAVMTIVVVVVVMVAGDGLTVAVLLLLITSAASLLLHTLITMKFSPSTVSSWRPGYCSVCVWFVLSLHGFYTTSHQPTFPTLHWSAAFVLGSGGGAGTGWVSDILVPAMLVVINTYSSHILFGLSLPLLLLAPHALATMYPKLLPTRLENEEMRRGEFILVEEPQRTKAALLSLSLSYILLHGAKVLFSAVAGFILRRHLMVWKIFAPHFIFEAVGFLVTVGSVGFGLTFTVRVLASLTSWIREKKHRHHTEQKSLCGPHRELEDELSVSRTKLASLETELMSERLLVGDSEANNKSLEAKVEAALNDLNEGRKAARSVTDGLVSEVAKFHDCLKLANSEVPARLAAILQDRQQLELEETRRQCELKVLKDTEEEAEQLEKENLQLQELNKELQKGTVMREQNLKKQLDDAQYERDRLASSCSDQINTMSCDLASMKEEGEYLESAMAAMKKEHSDLSRKMRAKGAGPVPHTSWSTSFPGSISTTTTSSSNIHPLLKGMLSLTCDELYPTQDMGSDVDLLNINMEQHNAEVGDGNFDNDLRAVLEDTGCWPIEPPTFTSATSKLTSNSFNFTIDGGTCISSNRGGANKRPGPYCFTSTLASTSSQGHLRDFSSSPSNHWKVRRMSDDINKTPGKQKSDQMEGNSVSGSTSRDGKLSTPRTFTRNLPPPTPETEKAASRPSLPLHLFGQFTCIGRQDSDGEEGQGDKSPTQGMSTSTTDTTNHPPHFTSSHTTTTNNHPCPSITSEFSYTSRSDNGSKFQSSTSQGSSSRSRYATPLTSAFQDSCSSLTSMDPTVTLPGYDDQVRDSNRQTEYLEEEENFNHVYKSPLDTNKYRENRPVYDNSKYHDIRAQSGIRGRGHYGRDSSRTSWRSNLSSLATEQRQGGHHNKNTWNFRRPNSSHGRWVMTPGMDSVHSSTNAYNGHPPGPSSSSLHHPRASYHPDLTSTILDLSSAYCDPPPPVPYTQSSSVPCSRNNPYLAHDTLPTRSNQLNTIGFPIPSTSVPFHANSSVTTTAPRNSNNSQQESRVPLTTPTGSLKNKRNEPERRHIRFSDHDQLLGTPQSSISGSQE
ncbi:hypothetical protein Pcinc_020373 [Petrolisthes cinctipes]|uniref:GPI ethanolamine phosphate transferase 3 n=1 Tax=Petrolisthes cinctipes TaxID=88211 RepID=A0AAE1KJV7_PETCI|nr:hypothetical protein Pcinc_020373 [Petrolisthes cinctipes]